ncbi:autotransporter-associated beta strand repeat-containing protein [Chania multitudinisentens]|uniref:autotransporter-associated beta strand repeat-containing protein n=1 Tax=Chania multitudinisentens TaxID=1639108 RepID=UPI0003E15399|nr:autotransporter-associated beta strand repeat-containing protein [Chania multitudinisentens]
MGTPDLSFGGGGGGSGNTAVGAGGAGGRGLVNNSFLSNTGTITGTNGGNVPAPGSGGGGGGGGALILSGLPDSFVNTGTITGGNGGNQTVASYAGGGGGGGSGLTLIDDITIINQGIIRGGDGGASAISYTGGGGAGVFLFNGGTLDNQTNGQITGGASGTTSTLRGDGGSAVLSNRGDITNSGTITGGATAGSGYAGSGITANGGSILNSLGANVVGGNGVASGGGSGISLVNDGGATLTNLGSISGGTGTGGGVGVTVTSNNNTVINAGNISGTSGANAVTLNGNNNILQLQTGYNFVGNIVASGSGNIFNLGGDTNASFDVTQIGIATNKFRGFNQYQKTGDSLWILTGTNTNATPWTIFQGILSISNDLSLGSSLGILTLAGGTLMTTADVTSSRSTQLTSADDTFDVATGTKLTLGGSISGVGSMNKTGSGILALSAANTYTGNTTINEGILQGAGTNAFANSSAVNINSGTTLDLNNFAQIANNLTGMGNVTLGTATLTVNNAVDTIFSGIISGSGNLSKTGLATLNLNVSNTYTGSTSVNNGTLNLGSNDALGQTSTLNTAANTNTNFNGYSQTVGGLNNIGTITQGSGSVLESGLLTNTGIIDLAGGTLTLLAGGTSTAIGGLTGAGTLNVNGGDLALSAANGGLSASTHIASGASVTQSAANALGTSAVEVDGTLNLTAADTLANVLSGAGVINTEAAISLSGSNSFSGTQSINAGGTLSISTADNLGTSVASVDLTDATAQLLLDGFTGNLANALSGVAGSTVQLLNASGTTLTGANSGFAGLFDLTGNSTLTVAQNTQLGGGSVSIGSGSTLAFDGFAGGALTALNNALNGAGNWVLRNSNISLAGNSNATAFSGLLDINTDASLTLDSASTLNTATVLNVNDGSSTLNISNNGVFTLNNALTGAGQVNVDTANNAFNFGAGVGSVFTGNVTLNNASFSLAGTNASALVGAGLTLNSGSDTTVGVAGTPSTETLQSLTLNGGTLNFIGGAPLSVAESTIDTQSLTANSGTINVMGGGSWENTLPVVPPNLSILEQNRGTTAMQLINADTASGAENLTLMIDGVAVTPQGVVSAINQNTVHVADATYNYQLSNTNSANASGLYLNYGLNALNLLQDNADALVIATEADLDANRELTAQLTGAGGIVFDASNGALTVTNSQNSYTGSTTVSGGNVLLGSNAALGATSLLTVASGASFNTNDFSQTVGALTNLGTVILNTGALTSGLLTNSGAIDLAGGILTLSSGGTSTGIGGLAGAGMLNVNGGDLALSAANGGLSASTHIASGASVTQSAANALGTSAVEVDGTLNLTAADTLANVLSGAGVINTEAAISLSGSNSFSGTQSINAGGTLSISTADNLGTSVASVDLTDATAQLLLDGFTGNLANALSGVAGSTVQFLNASGTTLTGANSGFAGLFDLMGNSTLTVAQNTQLGAGSVSIGSGSTLAFDGFAGGALTALNNALSGAGNWVLRNSNITLAGNSNATAFSGLLDINTDASLTLDGASTLNAATVLNVNDGSSTLNISNNGAFTLNNALSGAGQVNVDTANNAFNFGAGVGSAFTGNVTLNNASFLLAGTNASALAGAGLTLNSGSDTTVGVAGTPSTETLQSLTLNGGTLNFIGGAPLSVAESTIDTQSLTANSGTINVMGGGSWENTLPVVPPNLSILEQNRGTTAMQLINADTASGAENLTLMIDGVAVTPQGVVSAINQNTVHVADATYNYQLSNTNSANASGLYLNYGLNALNLLQDNADALVIATEADLDANRELTAQLTGAGGIVFDASNGALTVTNSQNSYTGSTTVSGGNVLLGSNAALGATSLLTVASGASFNTNDFSQTVGALTNLGTVILNTGALTSGLLTNSGAIDLAGGILTLSSGGTSTGIGGLAGAGMLNVNGGDLALSAANGGLSASTHIASGASVTQSAANALGTSAVEVDGTLNLTAADTLANVLSGAGVINTEAAISLSGSNSFSGTQSINAGGTLSISTADNLGTSVASVDLTDATAQLLLDGFTGNLANALSGVAGSTVQFLNASGTTLTGANSGFAGLFDLMGNSTLTVAQNTQLGGGSVSIGSGSTLAFDGFAGGALTALNNALNGAGNWVLRNSNISLAGNSNATAFSGLLDINTDASLTLDSASTLNAATVLNVNDGSSTLNISNNGVFTLNNALTGAGQVNVDTANNAFNFGAGVGSVFTGNVTLNNASFSLAGTNASALVGAGLTLNSGSDTTVGVAGTPSTETLQSLTLNGGTLNFIGGAPLSVAESTIDTQSLTANSGTINVMGGGSWENTLPVVPPNLSILEQNRGTTAMQLINADTASGAENLTLMIDGVAVTPQGVVSAINQNTVHVADATYNYQLSNTNSANASGLYLNYGLNALNLLQDNADALVIATEADLDANRELTAQLTGAGGIVFDASNGALTVTNSQNSYTGSTTVSGGNVLLGSNAALGATSLLTVASGASFNTNDFSQTVGALTNLGTVILNTGALTSGLLTNSGAIDLAGGILTLSSGGTSTGIGGLAGAGMLNVNGGDLALSAANGGLSASTHIASGASVTQSAANALGTSAVEVDGTLNLTAADTLANVLSGAGVINTEAAISLSGSNSFSGTQSINAGGALSISTADNLGTSVASVVLTDATAQLLLDGFTGNLANALSGVAGSTVQFLNASGTTLTGANSGFAGLFDLTGNSTLTVAQNTQLGAGSVSIGSGSTLAFDGFAGGALTALNNALSGAGNWVLRNSNITLAGNSNATAFSGLLDINTDASLTLDGASTLNAATVLNVNDGSSTLNISNNGAFTLNNALTGAGQVNVDTANNAFNFGAGVGSAFTGNVTLNNASFLLAGTNASALVGAGLTLNSGSDTTVGVAGTPSTETLQSLTLNGGTLNFIGGAPLSVAESTIDTQSLTANSGTINVMGGGSWENTLPVVPPNLSILEQNRGTTAMQLINADTASGAENLTLMIDGVAVTPQGVVSAINQNTVHVADATYNYQLSNTNSANASGLYLNYGLNALNLLQDNADALVIATEADLDANRELTAQLTGAGGIVFDASNGALTVTNSQNSYTGSTTVSGGNVLLGSNAALGATSLLTVASGASFNTNDFSQTVGALTNLGTVILNTGALTSGLLTNSGAIDLAGGILTLSSGGTSTGIGGLAGAGMLNVNGGDLALSAANGSLSASTHIASGASVTQSAANALGTSAVEVDGTLNLTAADTLANVLSGAGVINTEAAISLSGSNSFSGTQSINAGGALSISTADNLGTSVASVVLTDATSQLIFNGLNGDVANTLSGVANSTITADSGANLSLSGNNSGFGGQFVVTGNSALNVNQNSNLGAGSVTVDSGSQLVFSGLTGTLSNALSGAGDWVLSNQSNVLLNNGNAAAFTGTVSINGESVLSLDSANWFNPAATVDIVTANDTLNISNNGDFTFDNRLLGAGVLNINTNNNLFSFGSNVGGEFTGLVNLQNTQFQLSGSNTTSNSNTVLNLENNSHTSVGDGVQTIGALEMNGGTLIFNNIVDNGGLLTSEGTIIATRIDTTGGGTVSVNLPPNVSPSLEDLSILALDTGAIVVNLVKGAATGTGLELTLSDGSNTPIVENYIAGITNPNSSVVAAMGTFNFGLTTGDLRDGLYVSYSLRSMDLLTTGNDALELVGTASFNGTPNNELFAQITGSGDLAITEADPGSIVVISGTDNTYTGATLVRAGTLQLDVDTALGQTSNLAISSGAVVDINGHTQTVGALNSASDGTLMLNGGALTVNNGGVADGALTGAGSLTLVGGTLAVNNNNTGFSGMTTVDSGATASVTQAQGLGTGNIAVDGTLHLDGTAGGLAAATLGNALQGSGDTVLSNAADVTLSGDNSAYVGTFTTQAGTTLTATSGDNLGQASVLNAGSLVLNTAGYWDLTTPISGSGSLVKQGNGTIHIGNNLVSAGVTTVQSGALLVGSAPVNAATVQAFALPTVFASVSSATLTSDVMVQATGTFGGDGQVIGNVTNAGNLVVGRAATGNNYSDFIINGNYIGNGGNIALNSVLGGDDSATDRLVVTGNTSGTSTVTVSNIGGEGAKNINGIQVINVGGTSAGVFTLNGRAQAGVLEYFLYQGTPTTPGDGNWYLRSNYQDNVVTYTPESGGVIANIAAANTLFNTRLEDLHGGDARDTGDLSGAEPRSSLWLRQVGSRNKFEDASGQLSNSSSRYVAQLGGEVFDTSLTGQDRLGVGVMAGYGRAWGSSDSRETHYQADNSLTGYTVGMYGTWYANAAERHSPYVHGWLQYEWFKASVSSNAYDSGNYHLRGVSTSLEGGYPVEIYHGEENQTYITPQAQLTLNGAKMSDLYNNGSRVQQSGNNNLQTRLGAKLSNDTLMGKEKSRILTTYLDLNWIHNTRLPGVTSDDQGVQQTGSRHLVEVKVGAEGQVSKNFSVWGNLTQQIGQKGYDDKAAMLGVKYTF